MTSSNTPEQLTLFNLDDQFIFVFQSILTSGLLARIKPNALAVYLTMKTYAFKTGPQAGMCDLSVGRLATKCGIGDGAVKSAIKVLIEEKYLSLVPSSAKTRANVYRIYDLIPYESLDKSINGVLVAPHSPFELRQQREELQQFKRTGKLNTDTSITNVVINGDLHFHLYIGSETVGSWKKSGTGESTPVDELRKRVGEYFSQNIVDQIVDSTNQTKELL